MTGENHTIWMDAPGRVEIHDSTIPSPAEGEVLIRSRRSLISGGTELAIFEHDPATARAWNEFAHFPRRMGYSNAGVVADAGAGVPREWVGKRVASRGCHAAWITRPVDDLWLIPEEVSDDDATFATLAGVAMHGLRRAAFTWGETVAVFGLGIMGHLCARFCEAAGASRVFGVECREMRLQKLPSHPQMHKLKTGACPLPEAIRGLNGGNAIDLAIEATGSAEMIPEEIDVLRDQGRLLLLSSPRGPTYFDFHELCNRRSISIVGAHGFSQATTATLDNPWTRRRHAELFLEWLATGRVTVRELVTHSMGFDKAADAYSILATRSGEALALVFTWE